jgi:hypothetical protein
VFTCAWVVGDVTEAQPARAAITTYGERSADAPPELDAFAFLIGKWEGGGNAKTADGKIIDFGKVTWIGRYILDGMVIADEGHASAPDGSPAFGISFRSYDAARKTWIVEFLNVTNSFLRRQVNAASGSVTVDGNTVVVLGKDADMWGRETYRVDSHDQWAYSLDLSSDGGRTWSVGQVEMSFSRKE